MRASRADVAPPSVSAARVLNPGGRSAFSAGQHGASTDHLPATRNNIDLVGKLALKTPDAYKTAEFPEDLLPGQIADVAVYKNHAYLNSWSEPSCRRGGTFIADISNPAAPQQTGFLPALANRYHGEGAHVISLDTPTFKGDLLVVNNEPCDAPDDDQFGLGGFDLYDVTNPAAPKTFVQGFGDTGPDDGSLEGDFPTANSSHSSFLWQGNDRRAYLVIVDNVELHDVDIFEVTNPADPQPVGEFDFVEVAAAQGVDIVDDGGLGGAGDIFLHDMVVKKIGDNFIMMANYWDAGYLTFDVTNPGDPRYISDSTFDGPDPLTGVTPQEGNGHQGEFSHDNQYILAADEDFSPYRPGTFEITSGAGAGEYDSISVGGGASAALLPDHVMNGPTVFGGYGCDASTPIPPRATSGLPALEPGEEAIIVLERGPSQDPDNPEGACFPGEKAENGINAGYDAVLLTNHHPGEPGGVFCGSGDFPDPPFPPIVTVCTTHAAQHAIFGVAGPMTVPYPAGHGPAIGALGEDVQADSVFDGWGYTHLIRNTPGKMATIDSHAIKEALNPTYSTGYGDLSVHEFAADPTQNVAYSSYYSGGMRVFTFGPGGLIEQGKFIDEGGNNFWGVEQFTTSSGERLFAGSDRDYGLYLFRYTGPGAAVRPTCADQNVTIPHNTAVTISLSCSDANGNPLTRQIGDQPDHGTRPLTVDQTAGTVSYNPDAGYSGADSFTFTANDGAATSAAATVRITVTSGPTGCSNAILGTAARDLIAGTAGSDRINAAAGDDVVDARAGSDCLFGEAGNDVIDGEEGNDITQGGVGADRLTGADGVDQLFGNAGVDRLNGDAGNDRLSGGSSRDILSGGPGADSLFGSTGRDTLTGGAGNDRISGGSSSDRIYGNSGADTITPGRGTDRVIAAGGNDRIRARDGAKDRISCGSGTDRVTADRVDVLTSCERVTRR